LGNLAEAADVVIVDYGLGNLRSVLVKLARAGYTASISSSPAEIAAAAKLILPGVGSFERGATNLRELGIEATLNDAVIERGVPILGICLGMQLLTTTSDEGAAQGLGWIAGHARRFSGLAKPLRVPHVGQNSVTYRADEPLFEGIPQDSYFYFTHSYHVECGPEFVVGTTEHGYSFPSAIRAGNVVGVQFHPEKSHHTGLRLLRNFLEH